MIAKQKLLGWEFLLVFFLGEVSRALAGGLHGGWHDAPIWQAEDMEEEGGEQANRECRCSGAADPVKFGCVVGRERLRRGGARARRRSEDMELYQLIIPTESAAETVGELGDVGRLQFKDLNRDKSAFQRMYAGQVKRCEEMLRKLRFFQQQIDAANVDLLPASSTASVESRQLTLDELEVKLEELESETSQLNSNTQNLQKSYNELIEVQMVVEQAGAFFEEARADARVHQEEYARDERSRIESPSEPLLSATEQQPQQAESKSVRLGYVTGVIATDKLNSFERVLFRATRGNMYLRQAPIDGKITDPNTGESVEKSVFCVFFSGERARGKINKICDVRLVSRMLYLSNTLLQYLFIFLSLSLCALLL